jgi:hypothetical protein
MGRSYFNHLLLLLGKEIRPLFSNHPTGGPKADWFEQALGFNQDNMEQLASQIHFDENSAVFKGTTPYGDQYNSNLPITGTNGRTITVTFGWIRNLDGVVRLVTAIPTNR